MTQPLPKKASPVLAPLAMAPLPIASGSKRPPVPTKIGTAAKASRPPAPPAQTARAVKRDEPTLLSPPSPLNESKPATRPLVAVAVPVPVPGSVPVMRAPEPTMVESARFDASDDSPATEREPVPPSQCLSERATSVPSYRAEQGTLLSIPVEAPPAPPVRRAVHVAPAHVAAPTRPRSVAPAHVGPARASAPPPLPRVATLASVPPPAPTPIPAALTRTSSKPSAPPPLPRTSATPPAPIPMANGAARAARVSVVDASVPVATIRGFAPPPSLAAFSMGRSPEAPLPQPLDVVLPVLYDSEADPVVLPMKGPFRSVRRFFRLLGAFPRLVREALAERRAAKARPAPRRLTFTDLPAASLSGFVAAPPSSVGRAI